MLGLVILEMMAWAGRTSSSSCSSNRSSLGLVVIIVMRLILDLMAVLGLMAPRGGMLILGMTLLLGLMVLFCLLRLQRGSAPE